MASAGALLFWRPLNLLAVSLRSAFLRKSGFEGLKCYVAFSPCRLLPGSRFYLCKPNSIPLLKESRRVTVQRDGMVEIFAWKTDPGYAVHLLNYTNPNMLRGWFPDSYPISEQR